MDATAFWQKNQVGGPYSTLDESEKALAERKERYPELRELMPTAFPEKRVLDFGCGPGHDTILLLQGGAAHVFFADVSWQALQTTNDRLRMHNLRPYATPLFADDVLPQVDHVHCAGVLHHMHDPLDALMRLRAVAPKARMMVYDGERSDHSQSAVPITEWWTPKEFVALCREAEWKAKHVGSYECSAEWRPNCWAACYALT